MKKPISSASKNFQERTIAVGERGISSISLESTTKYRRRTTDICNDCRRGFPIAEMMVIKESDKNGDGGLYQCFSCGEKDL